MIDKDQVVGSTKTVKGKIKEALSKSVGDAKLEAEGTAEKIEGKVQNAVGGLKDAIQGHKRTKGVCHRATWMRVSHSVTCLSVSRS